MARYRRRSTSRRPQRVSWYPNWFSQSLSLPNDTTTVVHGIIGHIDLTDIVDHEAVLERMRGRLVIVKDTSGVGQFIVAGRVIPNQIAAASNSPVPDLTSYDDGDDYFFWQTFACVDSDATSMWNGAEIDSKAKRRLEPGSAFDRDWETVVITIII